jgi:NADH-quinone oxidoreductase subunit J
VIASVGIIAPLLAALPLAAINWHSFFFFLFAALACGFAVAVVAADNVVRMALYLVLSLAATAGLFLLAGAEFVGAMQLMIYVGGTLVLLVFGVMLTAQAPFVSLKSDGGDRMLAGFVAIALLGTLLLAGLSVPAWRQPAAGLVTGGDAAWHGAGGRAGG